jgi:hypothetical protein
MDEPQKYCPTIKGFCLEVGCSMYYHKDAQCAIISVLDILRDLQNLMLLHSDSCMEIFDLINVLNARTEQVQLKS